MSLQTQMQAAADSLALAGARELNKEAGNDRQRPPSGGHGIGITLNIVAIVGEVAKGRGVTRVTLEVGKLSDVMSDAIAFGFEVVAEGTALEGASLEILEIDSRARSEACGLEFEAETLLTPCPCGSHRLRRIRGEELIVKSIEMAEAA